MHRENPILSRLFIAAPALLLVVLIGTLGYMWLGDGELSWLDSLYMAVITISTVGFHEVFDMTHQPMARVFTMGLIFTGLGILLYSLSLVTAFLVEGELAHIFRGNKMNKRIQSLRDHIIVCGAGRTGRHIINELVNEKSPFVVIEQNHEVIDHLLIQHPNMLFIVGDGTEDPILELAGIQHARGLFTTIANDQNNLYINLSARSLNPKLRIISRATDSAAESKILKAGADSAVTADQLGAVRMLAEMERPAVASFFDAIIFDPAIPFRFEQYEVDEKSNLAGHKLLDLKMPAKARVIVIAIRDNATGEYIYNPPPETELKANTTLILLGEREKLARMDMMHC